MDRFAMIDIRFVLCVLVTLACCGVIAPLAAVRMHHARAMEAVVSHATLLTGGVAAQVSRREGKDGDRFSPRMVLSTEPGVEAVWFADGSGEIVAHEGSISAIEARMAHDMVGRDQLVVEAGEGATLQIAAPVIAHTIYYITGSRIATIGCRFAPATAVAALGLPFAPRGYLACIAGLGVGVILVAHLHWHSPPGRAGSTTVRATAGSSPQVSMPFVDLPTHLEWTRPVADSLAQSVLILDPAQRIVVANGAAMAEHWSHPEVPGHLLDLVERVPWGAVLLTLVDTVSAQTSSCAQLPAEGTRPALAIARLEQAGQLLGYWLFIHHSEGDRHVALRV